MSNRVRNHNKRLEEGHFDLRRCETYLSNRKQRRAALRASGKGKDEVTIQGNSFSERWAMANQFFPIQKPIFLGINKFKSIVKKKGRLYIRIYKQNAWDSFRALRQPKKRGKLSDLLSSNS